MASGVLDRCPADIAVSITGFAGRREPDEDGNPVGLVYVGVAARWTNPDAVECKFAVAIRDLSLECALLEAYGGTVASVSNEKAS
jgi:nicotinamide mononucleotide (NMN) deamidase PncC